MKPIPAIVQSEQASLEAEIKSDLAELRSAELRIEKLERQASETREAARLRRFELGRKLLRMRQAWPERGPKAKGWGQFLARIGIDDSTAWRYMQDAGGFSQVAAVREIAGETDLERPAAPHLTLVPPPAEPEPPKANRDAWCTPEWLTVALPIVDIDPCSNPRSKVRAKKTYSLEAGQDGLALPWSGFVYVNGPYSELLPWAEKLDDCYLKLKGAAFLVNADHSPAWWRVLTKHLRLRLDFNERLEFEPPPGVEPSKNDRPQSLLMDSAFWRGCAQEALLARGALWEMRNRGI